MALLREGDENTPDVPTIDHEAIDDEATSEKPKDASDGHSTSNIIEPTPLEAGNKGLIICSSKIQTDDNVNKSNLGKKINKIIANVTSWRSSKNINPRENGPVEGREVKVRRSNSMSEGKKSKVKQNSYWACYSFRREGNNDTKKIDPQLDEYLGFWN